MWLPKPVYERIPEFWVLLGLLFFALGLYVGFESMLTCLYLAVGAGCFVRGVWISMIRRYYRSRYEAVGRAAAESTVPSSG
jgi:hypothetical protein